MIFDVSNFPETPDSDLDPDLGRAQNVTIANDKVKSIAPGDWADVDPTNITADPDWGFSYQVTSLYLNEGVIGILVCLNPSAEPSERTYAETCLSPSLITNVFRRQTDEEA